MQSDHISGTADLVLLDLRPRLSAALKKGLTSVGLQKCRKILTVHQDRLGDVVGVVARDDVVDSELCCAPIQCLTTENTAEGA